jgi:hypothetical protein
MKPPPQPHIDPFRETLKEIYNMASFDWETMPEVARREFHRQILRMIEDAFEENPIPPPDLSTTHGPEEG